MTSRFPEVDDLASDLAASVLARAPTLGTGRLVCVDGPSGSGKTTLAAALDRSLRDLLRAPGTPAGRAQVRSIHMDNVYDGWTGLSAGVDTLVMDIVGPLRRGEPGRYRRYDWHRGGFAEERVVEPVEVLLVEGVGSGASAIGDAITCLVWVDTPSVVRQERWVARDGEQMREHGPAWREQEALLLAAEGTRSRADVLVPGEGSLDPRHAAETRD